VGLRETHVEVVDYNSSATPLIFYLDTSRLNKWKMKKAQRKYIEAVDIIRKHGENSPPALIIKAVGHSK